MKSYGWWAALAAALCFGRVDTGQAQEVPPAPRMGPMVLRQQPLETPVTQPTNGNGCGCAAGCTDEAEEPWRLFKSGCGVTLKGWIDVGETMNSDNPPSRFNGPVTFTDRNLGTLNQLYAVLEKPLGNCDDGCACWDLGFRVDVLYGSDYIFTQAAGLEQHRDYSNKWNGSNNFGVALPQAYGEIGLGKFSLKVGHFYTPIGYEGVMAPDNFFYSHPYTHQYGEPFTHTGGLLTYKKSDNLSFVAGLVNGWDKFDAVENELAGLAGVNWTSCDQKWSVGFNTISGNEDGATGVTGNRTMYSLVVKVKPMENVEYILQHDNGWQHYDAHNQTAEWYGVNQYVFYTINDCWKAGLRYEWFRDDDGVRVFGIRPPNPIAAGGFAGNFHELTAGLNWQPHPNLRVRPELRYDWYDGLGGRPYDDGNSNRQLLAAIDAVILW